MERASTPTRCRILSGRTATRPSGSRASPTIPRSTAASSASTIDGYFGGGGAGGSARPDFLPKFQHTNQCEFLDTLSWLRGDHQFKFGFDVIAPMKNEYLDVPADPRLAALPRASPATPSADFLLGYVQTPSCPTCSSSTSSHWSTSFFARTTGSVSRKLTLEPRAALRLHHARARSRNNQTQLRSRRVGQRWSSPRTARWRTGRWCNPDKNNFAPRIGLVYKLDDKTRAPRRLRDLLQPVRPHRQRGPARAEPAGTDRTTASATTSTTDPLFLMKDGFPADFLDPAERSTTAASACGPWTRTRPRPRCTSSASACSGELAGDFVVSARPGRSFTAEPRRPAQPQPAAPERQRAAARIRTSASSSGASRRPPQATRAWTCRSRSASPTGTASTWPYTIGEVHRPERASTSNASSSFPQDASDLESWEGPSDFDIRHRLVANFVAELPFGEGKKCGTTARAVILGGWTVSGHLHLAHRPALHGRTGQQQRGA